MTDHTHIDARLRDSLDDILYPMKAVSIEHYNTAMEMAEALINDAVRAARIDEVTDLNSLRFGMAHAVKDYLDGRIAALSKDKEK